jgi:diacylglycerol kinase family enzyme
MKKITIGLIASGMLLTFIPLQSNASVTDPPATVVIVKPVESAEVKALLLRLDEINAMDKSDLKSPEKKDLRVEVRAIKHQLSETDGGLYLSVGAIIIILLLLIILL